MFTGLIQGTGVLQRIIPSGQARRLSIAASLDASRCQVGASIAVSGACLTVIESDARGFVVEAAFETLQRTTLGSQRQGARLNLEPSLRMGDALDGHWVTGHVDGIGRVRSAKPRGTAREVWIDVPAAMLPLLAEKGSVCVDGVSLTVNAVDSSGFSVGLISHTLAATTLSSTSVGAQVNLEADVLARYVARVLQCRSSPPQPANESALEHAASKLSREMFP